MSRKITFTKAEREAVRVAEEHYSMAMDKLAGPLGTLLKKMDAASIPLPPRQFIGAVQLKNMLVAAGCTVVYPPNAGEFFWLKLDRIMESYGLTEEQAAQVAGAARKWRQPLAFDTVVYRVSTLLAQGAEDNGRREPAAGGWGGRGEFTGE